MMTSGDRLTVGGLPSVRNVAGKRPYENPPVNRGSMLRCAPTASTSAVNSLPGIERSRTVLVRRGRRRTSEAATAMTAAADILRFDWESFTGDRKLSDVR